MDGGKEERRWRYRDGGRDHEEDGVVKGPRSRAAFPKWQRRYRDGTSASEGRLGTTRPSERHEHNEALTSRGVLEVRARPRWLDTLT